MIILFWFRFLMVGLNWLLKKDSFFFIPLLCLSLLLSACADSDRYPVESVPSQSGAVLFELSEVPVSALRPSQYQSTAATQLQSVHLTLQSDDGSVADQTMTLDLLKFGNQYLTAPIPLPIGSYQLSQFVIVDEFDQVRYIAPIAGSIRANLVQAPLDIPFSIQTDITTKLVPEVLQLLDTDTPDLFGYLHFGFDPIDTLSISVSARIFDESQARFQQTSAALIVRTPGYRSVSANIPTDAAVSLVVPDNHGKNRVTLQVDKPGYKSRITLYTRDTLAASQNHPLPMTLVPITDAVLLPNGLRAYYPFEQSLADLSGNGLSAFGSSGFDADGVEGYALKLSGSGADVLRLTFFDSQVWTSGTVAFWMAPGTDWSSGSGRQVVFSKDLPGQTAYALSIALEADGTLGVRYGNTENKQLQTQTATWQKEVWHLVSVSWGTSGLSLYVDGQLQAFDPAAYFVMAYPTVVGKSGDGGDYFNGKVDGLRVYSRVLNAEEQVYLGEMR